MKDLDPDLIERCARVGREVNGPWLRTWGAESELQREKWRNIARAILVEAGVPATVAPVPVIPLRSQLANLLQRNDAARIVGGVEADFGDSRQSCDMSSVAGEACGGCFKCVIAQGMYYAGVGDIVKYLKWADEILASDPESLS